MAFGVSFKAGVEQSLQAARYFTSSAEEAMDAVINRLAPRQYLIALQDGASLRLRIWSGAELAEEELQEVIEWLRDVHKDLVVLDGEARDESRLAGIVQNWLLPRHGGQNFFLEQLDPSTAEATETIPELSLGVLGGRTVMVSTDTLMFTQLREEVYGLSIARQGSYLIGEVEQDRAGSERLRRA